MDWLPDALRDYHARSFPWQGAAPAKGVLHTTEGSGWPEYRGWTVMPHATILPIPGKGVTVRQHLPFSQGSFALVNAPGGVNTNGLHAFQFELVGTSEKGGPGLYWPDADDAVLRDLYKKVIAPLDAGFRIPFKAASFLPYPDSYGKTAARFTGAEWVAFSGWCGHQHVPENDHGDPGAFPWTRLAHLATGDDDMPLSADDIEKIAEAAADHVWARLITSRWNGKPERADVMLARSEQYAIEGGYPYNRPEGGAHPGAPTHAALLLAAARAAVAQTDTVEGALEQLAEAVTPQPDIDPGKHAL